MCLQYSHWANIRNMLKLLLSRREVSARQDAMTYLVRVRGLLVDGESRKQEVLDHIHTPNVVYIQT